VTGIWQDEGVAAHHGDPFREQRVLAEAVGVVDRSNRGVLTVSGPDRLGWLHNLTTQYLSDLAPLTGTELLVLSPHGHIEHHAVVVDDGETSWLDVEPGTAPALLEFLERMRFLTRVECRDVSTEYAVLSLVGPSTPRALAALGLTDPLAEPDILPVPGPKFPSGSIPPRPTALYAAARLPDGGLARRMPYGADLLIPRSAVAGTLATLAAADVPACGTWAFEALRVAARRPRLGYETDHRTIPHEVNWLATTVQLEKGCYRGQETVARVHNLGRPPRRLVLLHLDQTPVELPAAGTPVELNGRQVGFVGTVVRHYELGGIALAVIKRTTPDDAVLSVAGMNATIDTDDPAS